MCRRPRGNTRPRAFNVPSVRSQFVIIKAMSWVPPRDLMPLMGAPMFISVLSGTIGVLFITSMPLPNDADR